MRPAVAVSRPAIRRSVVDFPQPEGPNSTTSRTSGTRGTTSTSLAHLRDRFDRPEGGCWLSTRAVPAPNGQSRTVPTMTFTDSARGLRVWLDALDPNGTAWTVSVAALGSDDEAQTVWATKVRDFANGRLMSICSFESRAVSFPARTSSSVNRASRISPSVDRLRS